MKTGRQQMPLIFKKGMKEDLGIYRLPASPQSLRKLLEKIFVEDVSKHMKDKRVNGTSHHGFTKE